MKKRIYLFINEIYKTVYTSDPIKYGKMVTDMGWIYLGYVDVESNGEIHCPKPNYGLVYSERQLIESLDD